MRSYLEDKALFVAKESCFEVPAVDRRMLIRYIRLNFGESTSMSCGPGSESGEPQGWWAFHKPGLHQHKD